MDVSQARARLGLDGPANPAERHALIRGLTSLGPPAEPNPAMHEQLAPRADLTETQNTDSVVKPGVSPGGTLPDARAVAAP